MKYLQRWAVDDTKYLMPQEKEELFITFWPKLVFFIDETNLQI